MATTNHYQIIIIGSGPAGYTAALYAARANLNPLVLAGYESGGQLMITSDVENYPGYPDGIGGPEMMADFRKQAERFGATVLDVDATEVQLAHQPFTVSTSDETYTAGAVIIATGASAKWLGVPGEEQLRGRGVSACATCDGFFFRNKRLVVVGGGDTAVEEALFLTRYASSVTIVHRRDSLRASKVMQLRAQTNPKVSFHWNAVVDAVIGNQTVTGVRLRDVQTGAVSELETDGVFVAIGHQPNTSLFASQINLEPTGYIAIPDGKTTVTNIPGVFAAGDVRDSRYRQAVTAAGDGCRAAIDAERWLEDQAHSELHHAPEPQLAAR